MINWIKDHYINLGGISVPTSIGIINIIEKLTPWLSFISLLVGVAVGIGALVINRNKYKESKQRQAINDKILEDGKN